MKLTVGLLALLALGYLSTVLAGPLTGDRGNAEIADREPCEDVADCISEVQVINREDAEIVTGPEPCEDVADCMH